MKTKLFAILLLASCLLSACAPKPKENRHGNYVIKDNVIVFDAVDDRYPSYFNRDNPAGIAEDARKFYVAITRAKRRLYVSQCLSRIDFRGQVRQRQLTRFMNPILKYFD